MPCGQICSLRKGTIKQISIFSCQTLSQQRIWCALIKKQEWEREKGGKDLPDVNSKVCPASVCGQWSFVPVPVKAITSEEAAQQSRRILGSSSVKILDVGLTLLLLSNPRTEA